MRTNGFPWVVATALVLAFGASGCRFNPKYCEGNPGNNCDLEWDAPVGPECMGNSECAAPKPVCDVAGTKMCVECTATDASSCPVSRPVCDDDHTCRACKAHGECTSNVCSPDGSCADETTVAYVAPSGSGITCTKAAPCGTLRSALATSRAIVKTTGLVKDNQSTTIDGRAVTILADPGAILDRDGDGVILEVRNTGADVKIYDLQISGASGGVGDVGVSIPSGGMPRLTLTRGNVSGNVGGGIAVSAGMLTLAQSTISGNTGGGVKIDGAAFEIINSFIVSNGGTGSSFGGVQLNGTNNGTRRFDFNTVTNNNVIAGNTSGVVCVLIGMPVTFSNNIVFDNQIGGGRTQVGGANCAWIYSDIGPDTVSGTGNINSDPMFVNAGQQNYHVTSGSPAKNAADLASTLAIDVDGDTRPQGTARDIGADEIKE